MQEPDNTIPQLQKRIAELEAELSLLKTMRQSPADCSFGYLQDIVAHSSAALLLLNPNGVLLWANQTFNELIGLSEAVLGGQSFINLVHPSYQRDLKHALAQIHLGKKSEITQRLQLIKKDQQGIWVSFHARATRREAGEASCIVVTIRNINILRSLEDRLEMRMRLEKSILDIFSCFFGQLPHDMDEQVVMAFEKIGVACGVDRLYLLQLDGKKLCLTHQWNAHGVPPKEESSISGELERLPWSLYYLQREQCLILDTLKNLQVNASEEVASLKADGVQSLINFPILSRGTILGILGAEMVLKERIWSEEIIMGLEMLSEIFTEAFERKRSEQELQESEWRFRDLADSVPVLIWMSEEGLACSYANKVLLEFFGLCQEKIVQDTWEARMHAEDYESYLSLYTNAFAKRTPFQKEVRLEDNSGQSRYIFITGRPRYGTKKAFLGFILSGMDITSRRLGEEQKIRSDKLESVGFLAGGIAHDFNNLLTSVIANAELLNREAPLAEEYRQMINEILLICREGKQFTERLRIWSKGGAPVRQTFDLGKLLSNTCYLFLRGRKSVAELDISPNLAWIHADEGQISQVIQNLLINADEAMSNTNKIYVKARNEIIPSKGLHELPSLKPAAYVRVDVQDSGQGISKKNISKVFDPFFTTKSQGTGLGLATCQSIINRHDGVLVATSKPGEGSTFTFYIPATLRGAIPSQPSICRGKETPLLAPASGKILFVDDQESLRKIVKLSLSKLGYIVTCAENRESALIAFNRAREEKAPFDIVLLDLIIPGEAGGQEILAALKAIEPGLKAIVVSGYSDAAIVANYQQYGFSEALAKPFTIADLHKKILVVVNS